MPRITLTDEQVEKEIKKLLDSPLVKLAKKEQRVRYKRRQYLYCLRQYEKKGKELQNAGITIELLEAMDKETTEWVMQKGKQFFRKSI